MLDIMIGNHNHNASWTIQCWTIHNAVQNIQQFQHVACMHCCSHTLMRGPSSQLPNCFFCFDWLIDMWLLHYHIRYFVNRWNDISMHRVMTLNVFLSQNERSKLHHLSPQSCFCTTESTWEIKLVNDSKQHLMDDIEALPVSHLLSWPNQHYCWTLSSSVL